MNNDCKDVKREDIFNADSPIVPIPPKSSPEFAIFMSKIAALPRESTEPPTREHVKRLDWEIRRKEIIARGFGVPGPGCLSIADLPPDSGNQNRDGYKHARGQNSNSPSGKAPRERRERFPKK